MTYYAQTLIWPLLTAVLAVVILLSLHRLVARRWPKLKLLDRQQISRHPIRFVLGWVAAVGVWLACAALIYGLAERVGLNAPAGGHDHAHMDH